MFFIDKTFDERVPQLIPREPVNIEAMKAGFNSNRLNLHPNQPQAQNEITIDPTTDAPIAVFDGMSILGYRDLVFEITYI